MGLIARTIEQAGISTVSFNLLLATPSKQVRPPRTIWLPGNETMQRQLILAALEMLSTCRTAGTVLRLPYTVWGPN